MATSSKPLTLHSVAEACGVSASTVSRAFSRPDLVKQDVRERILRIADEMGYRPNRIARGLATGKLGMIGLIVTDITNPFFPPLVRSVQRAAAQREWSVLVMDADEVVREEASMISWVRDQVDGLIIASPRSTEEELRQHAGSLPTVVINRDFTSLPCVLVDNSPALAEAGDHLRALGHERCALIRGPEGSWAARQRATAVREWAGTRDVDLVDLGPYPATFDAARESVAALVDSGATAAFAFDDLMALGVIAGLNERGLQVPRDLSLVGCDDVLLARTSTPALTTVAAPLEALGSSAVQLLAKAFNEEAPTIQRFLGELILRDSTASPR